jgi:hypothetical protein
MKRMAFFKESSRKNLPCWKQEAVGRRWRFNTVQALVERFTSSEIPSVGD